MPLATWLRTTVLMTLACAVLAAGWLLWPAPAPDFSTIRAHWRASDAWLLDRHGVVIDQQRMDFSVRRLEWTPVAAVSPALIAAIVAGEDRRFWEHGGVDWAGVAAALNDTVLRHHRRGASTITMQLAQLMPETRVSDGPDWWRKLRQMRAARGIEALWTKSQILEGYLNLLGFRGELQGIAAAASVLAGKTPNGLNLADSLVLAALLPAPGASLERVAARACARAAAARSPIACAALRSTAAELLARTRAPLPVTHLAPQLASALLERPGTRVVTTLDERIQVLARNALARQLALITARNVRDGAALVADTQTGEVLAYVASVGAASRASEVDGIRAHRQAGSTLKPFLYELAIERGYLTAASLLDDSPVNLDTASGLYIPQNYDRDFKGIVSVRSALGNSLNVPAVRALVLAGVDDFRERLFELGYAAISRGGDYYGYSLALGSAEVSVWEQAQAYRTLARGGIFAPLRLQPGLQKIADRRLLSAGGSFIVTDILADRAARGLTFGPANHLNTPFFSAVKTGTSKDMRDNWCVGFSAHYTVAVWVGNFEGDSMHAVSGVTGAAPVWAELMRALHDGLASSWPRPPGNVVASNVIFTPAVEAARREWFIAGTQSDGVQGVADDAAIARIASPLNTTVIALDPDIPAGAQRVPIEARGALTGLRFRIDDRPLGAAAEPLLWAPHPGDHRLVLETQAGKVVDEVHFTVR